MSQAQRDQVDAIMRSGGITPGAPIAQRRREFDALMSVSAAPAGVTTEPGELGGRPALRFRPAEPGEDGVLLYFHGGAYVFGSPSTARTTAGELVARSGIPAVSVDYRLAPEHPFPAAVEDGLAAYGELLDSGVPSEGVVLAGHSAGGGLSVSTLLAAREAGLPMPAGAVLFSPGLDATRSGASMTTRRGTDPIFTREGLGELLAHYVGDHDPRDPLLSPAVTGDLRGLPPLHVQVGSHEVLLDDSTRLAARAAAADVHVILDVVAGVPHDFQSFAAILDEADAALDRAAAFVRARLHPAR